MDVQDSWENVYQIISFYGNKTEEFIDSAGPGHWHDADMVNISWVSHSVTAMFVHILIV